MTYWQTERIAYTFIVFLCLAPFQVEAAKDECKTPYGYHIIYINNIETEQVGFTVRFVPFWRRHHEVWVAFPALEWPKNDYQPLEPIIKFNGTWWGEWGGYLERGVWTREGEKRDVYHSEFPKKNSGLYTPRRIRDRLLPLPVYLINETGTQHQSTRHEKLNLRVRLAEQKAPRGKRVDLHNTFDSNNFEGTLTSADGKKYHLTEFAWIDYPYTPKLGKCALKAKILPYKLPKEQDRTIVLPSEIMFIISNGLRMQNDNWYTPARDSVLRIATTYDAHPIDAAIVTGASKKNMEILMYSTRTASDSETIHDAKKNAGKQLRTAEQQNLLDILRLVPEMTQKTNLNAPHVVLIISTEWTYDGTLIADETLTDLLAYLEGLTIVYLSSGEGLGNREFEQNILDKIENSPCATIHRVHMNNIENKMEGIETELTEILNSKKECR